MIRVIVCLSALLILSSCGGSRSTGASRGGSSEVGFATGPIYTACRQAGRREASRERCGCVQAVADKTLVSADQNRGAGFFRDPARAQEVRQSDRSIDERFWKRWKAYSEQAKQICS